MILQCEEFSRYRRRKVPPLRATIPFPNIQTNKTFMANRDDGFGTDELGRKMAYAKAKAQGVSTSGKFYNPQLQMWVESKDQIKKVCEERGLQCEGLVNVKGREPDTEPKPYRIADDIVQREVERTIRDSGETEIGPKEWTELTETTRERLMPVGEVPV